MNSSSIFSLLGLGACGGNQVKAFSQYNLKSFYINSAEQDLLSLGDKISYYLIPNAYGCHKDQQLSKQYLAEHYEEILKQIKIHLDTKYIFVFASLAGGTGSGLIALLIELIESELNKICIPIVTVPNLKTDTLQAKINAYKALKELLDSCNHSIFLVDNNKQQSYEKSNKKLSESIYSFISDIGTSTDGIFDQSEICLMLETKGYGIIASYYRKSNSDINVDIINGLAGGIHVNAELHNSLYLMGIKTTFMKKTVNLNIEEIKQKFGCPKDVFIGYQSEHNIVAMTGLDYPIHIIDNIYSSIQHDKEILRKEQEMKQEIKFHDDIGLGLEVTMEVPSEKKQMSARDRLLKMSKRK